MNMIQLLDCTLRDGAHLNGGRFGENVICRTIRSLTEAKLDIVEVGFFVNEDQGPDTSYFCSIEDVRKVLPKKKGNVQYSLMADFVDVDGIEPWDGTIDIFRLSFKRHRLDWALDAARKLMDKGYKVFINPVNCSVYTDAEYLSVINKVNELQPYGFSMVDTFGVLRKQDLSRLYDLLEGNLLPDITIGLHLHENLGLAYSLAQHFLEIRASRRKIVIDCSLLGMGRNPGNLCTEQIMDHMNLNYGTDYATEPALDAIDDDIAPIKREIPWGYSIPYALSGKFGLHRTYAEFLMGKNRLKTKDIQRILSMVDRDHIENFDEAYIEGLYRQYRNVALDDREALGTLCGDSRGKQERKHMEQNKIRLLVMDVDGTLTDGQIYIGPDGEHMKAFHAQDGYAIAHILPELGIEPAIITGRSSRIVEKRAAELKITHLYQGVGDKLAKLKELAAQLGLEGERVAYIGDDVNDLDCIRWCGLTACPADAVPEVLEAVDYVCSREGGRGAVREFVSRFLRMGR